MHIYIYIYIHMCIYIYIYLFFELLISHCYQQMIEGQKNPQCLKQNPHRFCHQVTLDTCADSAVVENGVCLNTPEWRQPAAACEQQLHGFYYHLQWGN